MLVFVARVIAFCLCGVTNFTLLLGVLTHSLKIMR